MDPSAANGGTDRPPRPLVATHEESDGARGRVAGRRARPAAAAVYPGADRAGTPAVEVAHATRRRRRRPGEAPRARTAGGHHSVRARAAGRAGARRHEETRPLLPA